MIGIEERGVGTADTLWRELLVRANHFQPIEDLKRAQEHPAFQSDFTVAQQVTTWAVMSKIVLLMNGDPQWQDVERARQYQAEQLGRAQGETFLADLLPLPANHVGHWPYPELFPDKHSYERQVLPGRIQALATLAQRHRPSFVFCYGKGHWDNYRLIFPEVVDYESIDGAASQIGRSASGALVILTPFFRWDAMGHARIERIVQRVRADRFTWYDDDVVIEPRPGNE